MHVAGVGDICVAWCKNSHFFFWLRTLVPFYTGGPLTTDQTGAGCMVLPGIEVRGTDDRPARKDAVILTFERRPQTLQRASSQPLCAAFPVLWEWSGSGWVCNDQEQRPQSPRV